jgi:CRP-like cAMP-binding protein
MNLTEAKTFNPAMAVMSCSPPDSTACRDRPLAALERLAILGRYDTGEPVYRCNDSIEHWYRDHGRRDSRQHCASSAVFLPKSRHDIADYLAMAVETVSRALTELRNRQTIAFRGVRHVCICNRNALQALTSGLTDRL